jgi:hypothetical protein
MTRMDAAARRAAITKLGAREREKLKRCLSYLLPQLGTHYSPLYNVGL